MQRVPFCIRNFTHILFHLMCVFFFLMYSDKCRESIPCGLVGKEHVFQDQHLSPRDFDFIVIIFSSIHFWSFGHCGIDSLTLS
ncbi:hypothetical protein BS17DRAFT_375583 [Gyrodon lividus]|nr:hypothetical protein BS17DRAFT_375583 [Gyrodon lividus]